MSELYPEIEPYAQGWLEVGEGNRMYWETCGNPQGKPALVVHGGPGSGTIPWYRRPFHPDTYRVVLFDQRNCGRSTPHASMPDTNLTHNTTAHLIADMERLREHLRIECWLIFGGSWGSTLTLAYAEQHPERVSEIVLFSVTTGRYAEFDWIFRGGVGVLFPEQWERLCLSLPESMREGDVVAAYSKLLNDADAGVRQRAAEAWCQWQSATPDWPPTDELSPRFRDPAYALAFARIVTHYARHYAWLEDGSLLRGADALAGIPCVMAQGRMDLQAPLGNAWALHRACPQAELVVVDDAGHDPTSTGVTGEIVQALDRFAGVQ